MAWLGVPLVPCVAWLGVPLVTYKGVPLLTKLIGQAVRYGYDCQEDPSQAVRYEGTLSQVIPIRYEVLVLRG